MSTQAEGRRTPPEVVAAIVNGLVVLLIPIAVAIFAMTRPVPGNTVVARVSTNAERSAQNLLVVGALLAPFVPMAMLAGWRTQVHAARVRQHQSRGWQGVLEAAALGFGLALLVLARGILTRPLEAPAYIIAYGGGAALVGLVIGIVLRSVALFVLWMTASTAPA